MKERKRLSQNDTIAIFIRDVKQILAANPNLDDVLERIAERMRKLVADLREGGVLLRRRATWTCMSAAECPSGPAIGTTLPG